LPVKQSGVKSALGFLAIVPLVCVFQLFLDKAGVQNQLAASSTGVDPINLS
jgi:hypothetical protein